MARFTFGEHPHSSLGGSLKQKPCGGAVRCPYGLYIHSGDSSRVGGSSPDHPYDPEKVVLVIDPIYALFVLEFIDTSNQLRG